MTDKKVFDGVWIEDGKHWIEVDWGAGPIRQDVSYMFSSRNNTWATPQDFFDKLNDEFHFDIDVCASKENAKCKKYYTIEDDGLSQTWHGVCWMNPPYGREISKWMRKAYESSLNGDGATVVCLVPSRTDTRWWHDYAMKADVIRYVKGRLKFDGHKNSAPFPSAVVIFNSKPDL